MQPLTTRGDDSTHLTLTSTSAPTVCCGLSLLEVMAVAGCGLNMATKVLPLNFLVLSADVLLITTVHRAPSACSRRWACPL